MKKFSIDEVHSSFEILTRMLINKQLKIAVMESCTSGLVASLITDTEGASEVFKGSDVTYSNEAKIAAGVSESVINSYGVYSKETAIAMAQSEKDRFLVDISGGITGSLGNVDPMNKDSIPGEADFAILYKEQVCSYHISIPNGLNRFESKLFIAYEFCNELLKLFGYEN